MQGHVERIWENQSSKGPYWVLKIDGERYTVWDPILLEGVEEGRQVAYEYKQSGNYRNISALSVVPSSDGRGSADSSGSMAPYANDRELRIVRMSALRSAAQLLYNTEMDWNEKVNTALDAARQFESYVMGEDTQPKPPASPPKPESRPTQGSSRPTNPPARTQQRRPQSR